MSREPCRRCLELAAALAAAEVEATEADARARTWRRVAQFIHEAATQTTQK